MFCRTLLILVISAALLAGCDDASERAVRHYDHGLELLQTGSPEKAALEFRNALRHDEGHVAARFELALLLEKSGDLNGAVANLRAVTERNPAHVPARIRLANAMLIAGAPAQAIEHAEVAVRAAPDLPGALLARALAAYRLGDTRIALADVTRALILDPGNADAGLLLAIERHDAGDTPKALNLLDQFIEHNPRAPVLQLTKLSFLREAKDHVAIGALLGDMVRQFPDRIDVRQSLVQWHLRNDDTDAAQAELRSLQALMPDQIAPVLAQVKLHARTEGNEVARALLEAEIAAAVQPDALRLELARFDIETGHAGRAADILHRLIDAQPDGQLATEARLLLAGVHVDNVDFDTVDAHASAVLATDPGNADAMSLRALAHLHRDRLEDALFDIRTALAESPDDPGQLMLAAEIYRRNGSPGLAGASLASAVRAGGFAPEITLVYSRFLRDTGQSLARKTLLEEALRQHPEASVIAIELLRAHMVDQDWPAAEALMPVLAQLDESAASHARAELAVARREYKLALDSLHDLQPSGGNENALTAAKVRTLLLNGEAQAAQDLLTKGLKSRPSDPSLIALDAKMQEMQGAPEQAETSYRKLVEFAPESGPAYTALASFMDRQGRGADALKTLEHGLKVASDRSGIRLHLASLNLRLGDTTAAIAQFERLFAEQPDSDLAANNLASALAEYASDDPEQIARAERIARRLAGSANPAFLDTYGWTKVLTGDVASGVSALQIAAEQLADNPWVRYHAGIAFWKLQQNGRARKHLQAALSLSEGQPFQPRDQIMQVVSDLGD